MSYARRIVIVGCFFVRRSRFKRFSNDFYLILTAQRLSRGRRRPAARSGCGRTRAGTLERLCPCWRHYFDRLHGSGKKSFVNSASQGSRNDLTFVSNKAVPPAEIPKPIATHRQNSPRRVPVTVPLN